jgi:hypothetical protein
MPRLIARFVCPRLLRRKVRVRSMPSVSPCQPWALACWRRWRRSSSISISSSCEVQGVVPPFGGESA